MKTSEIRCRKCGRSANQIGGYLHRVNEKGVVPAIWECAPSCDAKLTKEQAILEAIKGDLDSASDAEHFDPCYNPLNAIATLDNEDVTDKIQSVVPIPDHYQPPSVGRLEWNIGPARGGRGTRGKDEHGRSLWSDGDKLAVLVELSSGEIEQYFLFISCDEHFFSVTDQDGNEFCAWSPDDWSYWALLDESFYPAELRKKKGKK